MRARTSCACVIYIYSCKYIYISFDVFFFINVRLLIDFADLKKPFTSVPYSVSVETDRNVELRCLPPDGVPPPRVYWLRNNVPIEPDNNMIVSSEGNLLIGQARLQDTANYTCVAENVAAKRLSDPALLTVYGKCLALR